MTIDLDEALTGRQEVHDHRPRRGREIQDPHMSFQRGFGVRGIIAAPLPGEDAMRTGRDHRPHPGNRGAKGPLVPLAVLFTTLSFQVGTPKA